MVIFVQFTVSKFKENQVWSPGVDGGANLKETTTSFTYPRGNNVWSPWVAGGANLMETYKFGGSIIKIKSKKVLRKSVPTTKHVISDVPSSRAKMNK